MKAVSTNKRAIFVASCLRYAAARRAHFTPDGSAPDRMIWGCFVKLHGAGGQLIHVLTIQDIVEIPNDITEVAFRQLAPYPHI
eukprot:7484587-Pyramimonas_sp.AAC.1